MYGIFYRNKEINSCESVSWLEEIYVMKSRRIPLSIQFGGSSAHALRLRSTTMPILAGPTSHHTGLSRRRPAVAGDRWTRYAVLAKPPSALGIQEPSACRTPAVPSFREHQNIIAVLKTFNTSSAVGERGLHSSASSDGEIPSTPATRRRGVVSVSMAPSRTTSSWLYNGRHHGALPVWN